MTKPKTPLIALQGGLVLSALRKKKKMSDDPFAWYPFAAESAPMMSTDDAERKTTPAQNNDEDNQSVSGDSVADHDPQPRIVLPPGLTLDKKSRSSASVVSLGSWEPLDLMDLEPADSGESEEGSEGSSSVNEEDSASKTAAKTLASDDDASSSLGSRRVTVSYFASHVSVVIVMLSLTFLGTKRSPVKGTSLMSIRGAAKPSATTSLAILAIEPTEDMDAKAKFSNAIGHVARTGDAIRRNLKQQMHGVDAAATMEAIKNGHHSVVSFLLNPAGQKDLPPFELIKFVDSMMLL